MRQAAISGLVKRSAAARRSGSLASALPTSLGTCELTATGPAHCADAGWTVAANSSPSASPFSDGSAAVAFQGGGGQLSACRVTNFGGSNCWAEPESLGTPANPKVTSLR